ncbi:NTP transferase domain-containing protein [Brucella intermedia]|uniref:NTP transferase domain-containing protein n=1 Tax=Brucella intermedia TaxID=94625 RepID=UPI003AB8C032
MKLGEFSISEAEGTLLAHTIRLADGSLKKGHLLSKADIKRLHNSGISTIAAAQLACNDLREDEAATRLAQVVKADHLRFSEAATGRVNIYATVNGLFLTDRQLVDRLNTIDSRITFACLADHVSVSEGDIVATFKIIPIAVPGDRVEEACDLLRQMPLIAIKPFTAHAVSLIATQSPSLKVAVMDKTTRILNRRLSHTQSRLIRERRVAHRTETLAMAIRECLALPDHARKLLIVFGASGVIDEDDVIPAAIRQAGGEVIRVGMPVEPGNMLVLGRVGDVAIIGAPGCARSPKENGFDWVLNRILADEMPSAADISGMGVGGLLREVRSQSHDIRANREAGTIVAIVVLAAGEASRMGKGGAHKLLAEFDRVPLVRRSTERALNSSAESVVVVTGHRHAEIEGALAGLNVVAAFNPDYASGMASSLASGFCAPEAANADGVMVILADMPQVTTEDIDVLIAEFRASGGDAIVRAVSRGKRGNPVILPRFLRDDILRLEGDVGARHLIENSGLPIIDVEIGHGAHLDVDTPEEVIAAGGVLNAERLRTVR